MMARIWVGILLGVVSPAIAGVPETTGRIDRLLSESWPEKSSSARPPVSDEGFLRRIYLDAIGRIPTYAEAKRFLESGDPERRSLLIEELLSHPGYVDHLFIFWADLLRIHDKAGGGQFRVPPFEKYLRQQLAANRPYDELVRELITARGDASWGGNPAAAYTFRDIGNPLDHMADTVQRFLGTRMQCAQCHNHPFDRWTQMEFYRMAGFSYGMNLIQQPFPRVNRLADRLRSEAKDEEDQRRLNRGLFEVTKGMRNDFRVGNRIDLLPKLPHDYQYDDGNPHQEIIPAAIYGEHPEIGEDTGGVERVEVYARWMTSRENPRFARVMANRMWKRAMGVGLIEPVDDLRDETVASRPRVLDLLETVFVESGFDVKTLHRVIFNSRAYQGEALPPPGPGDPWSFEGPVLRRLTAEQLWDSIVALMKPNPESTRWREDHPIQVRWIRHQLEADIIRRMDDGEILDWARKLAENRRRLEERGAADIQATQYAKVEEWIFEPAFRKMEDEGRFPELEFPDGTKERLTLALFERGGTPPLLKQWQEEVEERMLEREMEQERMDDPGLRQRYRQLSRNGTYFRASHLGAPSPLGHLLRDFGQSDREAINNSNRSASIPQVLQLMNGDHLEAIGGDRSMIALNLARAGEEESPLDVVFLSILSRYPTDEEREIFAGEENPVESAVFALMNSARFLFVE